MVVSLILIGLGGGVEPVAALAGGAGPDGAPAESLWFEARTLPVAYDVDVLVVGGASAGVTAAVEAARQGASVFVAAERAYLGDDLCGTYRLWLGPDEVPEADLERDLFAEPPGAGRVHRGLPFTYKADLPSAPLHPDTDPPSLLTDGQYHTPVTQSVQYDGDVTIDIDFGETVQAGRVRLLAYQRVNDFEVATMTLLVPRPDEPDAFKIESVISNPRRGIQGDENIPIEFMAEIPLAVRNIRLIITRQAPAERVLLGEIIVEPFEMEAEEARPAFPPHPMNVKRGLDRALLDAGVDFLFGCYPTQLLRDDQGQPAGIVMVNRSGPMVVRAKTIIDVTPRATVARMAGSEFPPYPTGDQVFHRVVLGGEMREGPGVVAEQLASPMISADGRSFEAIAYTLTIPMQGGGVADFNRAEQIARDRTWSPPQADASETLFQVPPDPMRSRTAQEGPWPGAAEADLDWFRPQGMERLFVLGGCAGLSRKAADSMLRPLEYMAMGRRLGAAAAREAARIPAPVIASGEDGENVPTNPDGLTIQQAQTLIRPTQTTGDVVTVPGYAVPVLGRYDVVVTGGGTGGAPAGISAARAGADTLILEYLHGLGGVGTLGMITRYWYGYRHGFTAEMDRGVADLAGEVHGQRGADWKPEAKMEWLRRQARQDGAEVWFGVFGAGAVVVDNRAHGVLVATPFGPGVVLAGAVVDSTGSADMAAAAGAQCVYTDGSHIAIQGTGLPPRELGAAYTNTDYTFVDDSDVLDTWRAFVMGREKYAINYDLGQIIDTRERRQIVGDYFLTPLDIYTQRHFHDTINIGVSNFDSHGFTIHPIFMIDPPDREALTAHVPYRSLLPKGIDGVLVTGLGVSAHRDAMPVIRMQPDIQNQGYSAGRAAAMAVAQNMGLRDIDIKALQGHLAQIGILPEDAIRDADDPPPSDEEIRDAVASLSDGFDQLPVLMTDLDRARPHLQAAYRQATDGEEKTLYAHMLGLMGDGSGAEILQSAVASAEQWDAGWSYTGMGQFGPSMSPLDSRIIALGRVGGAEALPVLLDKARLLGPDDPFSHHRAVAVALETIGDPAAAPTLAALLSKPGMTGHAKTDVRQAMEAIPPSGTDNTLRERSLVELVLARALYRCGDHEGLGEQILTQYSRDHRGHYARHALAVLSEGPALELEQGD